jgi:carbon monoxide dehydrogenase subunit G
MDLTLHVDVAAKPDQVAELLLDFAGLHRWHHGVEGLTVEGKGVGAIRSYRLGTSDIRERLDEIADDKRSMQFTVLSHPLPVSDFKVRYVIEEKGAGARVHWHASMSAMKQLVEAMGQAAIAMEQVALDLLHARFSEGIALRGVGD